MRKILIFIAGLLFIMANNCLFGQKVTNIAIYGSPDTIPLSNGTAQLYVMILPSNAANKTIQWSLSCASDTATIDQTGHIYFYKSGIFKVKAKALDSSNVYTEKVLTIFDQLQIPVSNISLSNLNDTIKINGDSLIITATITPANATNKELYWWVSGSPDTATFVTNINQLKLFPHLNGNVRVRASTMNGPYIYAEKWITITNQIFTPATSISISSPNDSIYQYGGSMHLNCNVLPSNASIKSVNWSIVNYQDSLANIDMYGNLYAHKNGVVTVRATAKDGSGKFGDITIVLVNQSIVYASAITLLSIKDSITGNGDSLTITANIFPENATNKYVNWWVSKPDTATFFYWGMNTIKLIPHLNGQVLVRASTISGPYVYAEKLVTITNQIYTPVSSINIEGPDTIFSYHGTINLWTSVNPSNASVKSVLWSVMCSPDTAVISPTGYLTGYRNSTIKVRATAKDGSGVYTEKWITIKNQPQFYPITSITLSSISDTIKIDKGTLTINATILPLNASNPFLKWNIVNIDSFAARVDSFGHVKAFKNGMVLVRASAMDGSNKYAEKWIKIINQTFIPISNIAITSPNDSINLYHGGMNMYATITPLNASRPEFSWSVTCTPDSAKIEKWGWLTAFKNGKIKVRATAMDGSGIVAEKIITMTNQTFVPITGISMTTSNDTIETDGGFIQVTANVIPSNATYKNIYWYTDSLVHFDSVSYNNPTRQIFANHVNGIAKIRVTSQEAPQFFAERYIKIINQIFVPVSSISIISPSDSISVYYGVMQLGINILPFNATNKKIIWSIIAGNSIANIDSWGYLRANGTTNGTVTVRASSTDGSNKFVDKQFFISNQYFIPVSSISINSPSDSIKIDKGTLQLSAIVTPVNATYKNVFWHVNCGSDTAFIDYSGKLFAYKNGYVRVTARSSDSTITAQKWITIINQSLPIFVSSISVTSIKDTLVGGTMNMVANVLPANATNKNVQWKVTCLPDSTVAFINNLGVLSGYKNGTATVRATALDGSGKFGEKIIQVRANANIAVSSISVTSIKDTLVGGTMNMVANVLPANATNKNVQWKVTCLPDSTVAFINNLGVLSGYKNGTAVVRATALDGSGKFGEKIIQVRANTNILISGISISPALKIISVDKGTLQLSANILPANATNKVIQWSVNDTAMAKINGTGIIQGFKNGKVVVKVQSTDGSGVFATDTVSIINQFVPVKTIAISSSSQTISIFKGNLQLNVTVSPSDASNKNVTWFSKNPLIASVNSTGLVSANQDGIVLIQAKSTDGPMDSILLTINNQFILVNQILVNTVNNSPILNWNDKFIQMVATVNPANAQNKLLKWSVSDTLIAKINQSGLLTAFKNGTVIVKASATDSSKVVGTDTVMIIGKPIPVTTISVKGMDTATTISKYKGSLQMIATIYPFDATNKIVNWSVSNKSVAWINNMGILYGIKNGVVWVKGKSQDGGFADSVKITLSHQYLNRAPIFDDNFFTLNENAPNKSIVGVLSAFDPDAGQKIKYKMIAGNKGSAFFLNDTSGVITVADSTLINFTTNPEFNITVVASDRYYEGELTDTAVIIIKISQKPYVEAGYTFYANNTLMKVNFYDASVGNIDKYYWTFGDGSYLTGKTPIHTYAKAGIYNVCLTVFSTINGLSHQACQSIKIGETPCNVKADFSLHTNDTIKTIIVADASIGNPYKWYWNFGDGMTSENSKSKHTYQSAGYYLVSLSISDSAKKCTDFTSKFIKVGTISCRANYGYTVDVASKSVTFSNTSEGDLSNYFWNFGNGKFSTEKSPSYTYNKEGMYKVSLTVANTDKTCIDNYESFVQVGVVSCNAQFNYFVDSITNTAYFTDQIMGESTNLFWSFGDGSSSFKHNPTHKYLVPGYYTIGLNTYNQLSGCMDYFEKLILVGSEGIDCEADFVYQVNSTTREISVTNKSKGDINKYLWNFGDGIRSISKDTSHYYNKPGFYNVCLTVFNKQNISNISCKLISIEAPNVENCEANFEFSIDSINKKASFSDKSLGTVSKWEWEFGDKLNKSSIQNPENTYTTSGFYLVSLKIRTATGCVSKTYKLISINQKNEGFVAAFGFDPADSLKTKAGGYPVEFVGAGVGDHARLRWDFGDGQIDSTTTTPNHNYSSAGTYDVCYQVSDPISGLADTVCQKIEIKNAVNTPSVFSNEFKMKAYPIPFSNQLTINYSIAKNELVDISIFDLHGRKLQTIVYTNIAAGEHNSVWNTEALQNGVYLLKINTSEGMTSKLIIKQ
jgi:PKD repeat protein/uncharacterized protein YjdB